MAEISPFSENVTAWVQEFRFPLPGKYLDLRAWDAGDERFLNDSLEYEVNFPTIAVALIFSDRLTMVPDKDVIAKQEYVVTQFIADVAERKGFSGIIYSAARHFGDNLVLFDLSINREEVNLYREVILNGAEAKICREGVCRFEGHAHDFNFEFSLLNST